MQTIAQLLGYTPIDIHSHFDHGVPGDYQTIAWADISDDDKKKILADNALRLFPGLV